MEALPLPLLLLLPARGPPRVRPLLRPLRDQDRRRVRLGRRIFVVVVGDVGGEVDDDDGVFASRVQPRGAGGGVGRAGGARGGRAGGAAVAGGSRRGFRGSEAADRGDADVQPGVAGVLLEPAGADSAARAAAACLGRGGVGGGHGGDGGGVEEVWGDV